ncbi:hypothetical protein ACOME3_004514 [Neoechinorhynchus agilis]
MSIQAITDIPFLCIDEINQGMDPENERKIFELMLPVGARMDPDSISATILVRSPIPNDNDENENVGNSELGIFVIAPCRKQ